uniref:Uncharacterized protein n=1 Tax=Peronospora matthiolae TaxID=2874970 RepID=A0AAV1TSE6_9STRA
MTPNQARTTSLPDAFSNALAGRVQSVLEAHGWKLLGAVLLFYVGMKRYREWAARRRHRQILAAANDPARVAALERAAALVRGKQQQEFQAQSMQAKRKKR